MKRTLFLFAAMVALIASSAKATVKIPSTSLTYDVVYHWGLINKVAGHGYVNYHTYGNTYMASLQGSSIPWGGKIYTVNSSLRATFGPERDGVSTETVDAIRGVYSKPDVGSNPHSAPYRTIYGAGTLDASSETMEAVTIMSDMLSIFYYARQLGFATMPAGRELEIPIVRDGVEQTLYITYKGVQSYSYGGYSTEAYAIEFRYTYNGAPDRFPVTCLIGTDSRIPVMFSADLLIGHVEMRYVP